mmetsp:Transcript_1931/g.6390  ORF Transcript_1931/g.6390 Transcript_1931/m.6390 type:complete len:214 (+) Transcript_1931:346-987(+)
MPHARKSRLSSHLAALRCCHVARMHFPVAAYLSALDNLVAVQPARDERTGQKNPLYEPATLRAPDFARLPTPYNPPPPPGRSMTRAGRLRLPRSYAGAGASLLRPHLTELPRAQTPAPSPLWIRAKSSRPHPPSVPLADAQPLAAPTKVLGEDLVIGARAFHVAEGDDARDELLRHRERVAGEGLIVGAEGAEQVGLHHFELLLSVDQERHVV